MSVIDGPNRDRVAAAISEVVDEFRTKDLLLRASGIGFRVVVATVPAALFLIAVLGSLGLDELWTDEAAPALRQNVSGAVYVVVDDAVTRVLEGQSRYWITIGALVALGSTASIVQGVAETLNAVHGVDDDRRSLADRAKNAILLGAAAGILLLTTIAVVRLGPFAFDAIFGDGLAVGVLSFVVRWTVAVGLLVLVVALTARIAPDVERRPRRLAAGSAITVGGWVAMSLAFGLYLRHVAAYESIFGNLATAYVALQYIALSVTIYVGGMVVDAIAIRRDSAKSGSTAG